jgi:NADPH:quinone reductase-like Zn-dependent oxidoreductase
MAIGYGLRSDMLTARQFWIQSPGHGAIVSAELAPRQASEVLVRARFSGISRGTESVVFNGEVPPSQYQSMRAPFQEGDFPGPVKYGYASVGDVEEGPAELAGRTVFCLHPHQDRYCVPASGVTPLPKDVPADRAVLAANMETAVNAVWDAGPMEGRRIVVIGGGVVGLLIAWLCRQAAGTSVTLVDLNAAREPVARALGVPFLVETPGEAEADLVIHASGRPDGLVSALAVAGFEATIVEVSWYGSRMVSLPLGEAFHSRRLTIKSSQVGHVPPDRRARWTRERRLTHALQLLRDPTLDVLVSGESVFDDLPEVLATLCVAPGNTLCHRIRYPNISEARESRSCTA